MLQYTYMAFCMQGALMPRRHVQKCLQAPFRASGDVKYFRNVFSRKWLFRRLKNLVKTCVRPSPTGRCVRGLTAFARFRPSKDDCFDHDSEQMCLPILRTCMIFGPYECCRIPIFPINRFGDNFHALIK